MRLLTAILFFFTLSLSAQVVYKGWLPYYAGKNGDTTIGVFIKNSGTGYAGFYAIRGTDTLRFHWDKNGEVVLNYLDSLYLQTFNLYYLNYSTSLDTLFINSDTLRLGAENYWRWGENAQDTLAPIADAEILFFDGVQVLTDYWTLSETNTFLGIEIVGMDNLTDDADNNTGMGYKSLYDLTKGDGNVAIGNWTLGDDTTGNYNTAVGYAALYKNLSAHNNTAIGYEALYSATTGGDNTALGYNAGRSNIIGTGNVFIGFRAGEDELGSDKLYIENTDGVDPLIWGDFLNDTVRINGALEVEDMPTAAKAYFVVADAQGATLGLMDTTDWRGAGGDTCLWERAVNKLYPKNWLTDSVGIGTDDPTSRLGVQGNITQGSGYFIFNSGLKAIDSNDVVFFNNSDEGLTIDNDGYLYIDTIPKAPAGYFMVYDSTTDLVSLMDTSGWGGGGAGADSCNWTWVDAVVDTLKNNKALAPGVLRFESDVITDRWLETEGNTIFGRYAAGLGRLSHSSGSQGWYNTVYGNKAGYRLKTGYSNTIIGREAFELDSTGLFNVAIGDNAMANENANQYNIAIGADAMFGGGDYSVAIGYQAGYTQSTTASYNTLIGYQAGYNNTQGQGNTAVGDRALRGGASDAHSYNVAIGGGALYSDKGNANTAVGYNALYNNTTAASNTAMGYQAGQNNLTGTFNVYLGQESGRSTLYNNNTYVGFRTGYQDSTGRENVYIGAFAGYNGDGFDNVFIGDSAGYNETRDEMLYIDNTPTSSPLLEGYFALDSLVINGSLTISGDVYFDPGGVTGVGWDYVGNYVILEDINDSVGIGDATPDYKLDIEGNTNIVGILRVSDLNLTSLSAGTSLSALVLDGGQNVDVNNLADDFAAIADTSKWYLDGDTAKTYNHVKIDSGLWVGRFHLFSKGTAPNDTLCVIRGTDTIRLIPPR